MKKAALSGLTGLAFLASSLAGCADMLTKDVGYQGPEIKRPELADDISKSADEQAKEYWKSPSKENLHYIKTACKMYSSIGSWDKARECAREILKQDPDSGLNHYSYLQGRMPSENK